MIDYLKEVNVSIFENHIRLDFSKVSNFRKKYIIDSSLLSVYGSGFTCISIKGIRCNSLCIDYEGTRVNIGDSNIITFRSKCNYNYIINSSINTIFLKNNVGRVNIARSNINTIYASFIAKLVTRNKTFIDTLLFNYLGVLNNDPFSPCIIDNIYGFVFKCSYGFNPKESMNIGGKKVILISDRLKDDICHLNTNVLSYIISVNI